MTETPLISRSQLRVGTPLRMTFGTEPVVAYTAFVKNVSPTHVRIETVFCGAAYVSGVYRYGLKDLLDSRTMRVWILPARCPKRVRKDGPLC